MKKNIAIKVNNVSIIYKTIVKKYIKSDFFKMKKNIMESYEAVKNVSFEVKKGEVLGIIGENGSGKSTLLKAIAGIFSPDEGNIETYNNTISLLSIGIGFQKRLTGYENIFLSGMLLGFSKKKIEDKINEIIAFSELGEWIYKPVRTYSSGMYSKLAFSITAILETDIMLIDEVLSVGDIKFKAKSFNKIKELIQDVDRTVVIVSHSLETLNTICDRILWMHKGEIKKIGDTKEVLTEYQEFMK